MSMAEDERGPRGLWGQVLHRSREAAACGALCPVRTEQLELEEGGVRFQVRRLVGHSRKPRAPGGPGPAGRDPFAPPEPELFVAELSATHFALLNKYPVIDHHLLIVTRRFEEQERLLTPADFEAVWRCLAQVDALVFYNGGRLAGASQGHKHLQLVPRRLAPGGGLPVDPWLAAVPVGEAPAQVPAMDFRHAFLRLAAGGLEAPAVPPDRAYAWYRALLQAVGLGDAGGGRQSGPYNLLLTREWMLLVPRSREDLDGIPNNALGYAGSLFVRNARQLQRLRSLGPLAMLRAVGLPR